MTKLSIAPEASAPADKPHPRLANRLLAALTKRDFEAIEPHLEVVALPRGRVLFEPGDDVTTTYFPCHRAMVSLLIVTRDGREDTASADAGSASRRDPRWSRSWRRFGRSDPTRPTDSARSTPRPRAGPGPAG